MANAADVARLHGQTEAPAAEPLGGGAAPRGREPGAESRAAKAGAGESGAYLCQGPWEPRHTQHQQRQQQ